MLKEFFNWLKIQRLKDKLKEHIELAEFYKSTGARLHSEHISRVEEIRLELEELGK